MSAETIRIEATTRNDKGSANARRMRREGFVPAVVYSGGNEGINVQLPKHEFTQMLRKHASESLVVDLAIKSHGEKKALLKDVQHHPLTGDVLHVDFLEISMTEVIRVDIALVLVGTPVGVSQDGGLLDSPLHSIEVECLPGDIMERIEVDVSEMEIGQHRTVGELGLDSTKYTVLTAPDIAMANVLPPRVTAEAEEAEAAEAAAAAEPEVLTEKKEDEDEG